MPVTGILAIVWDCGRAEHRARPALETLSALAAAVLLTVSTATTVLQQSALDGGSGRADRTGAGDGAATLPARETMVGAYTGVPYTYPSRVTIGKEGNQLTIDPVHWYTDPFDSPIYYGARVARWFGGGSTGMMVDFIHSKAMAELDQEASFTGTIDGKPLAPRAPIRDIVKKLEFSHGHNMLLFNGLLRLPTIGARFSPYVGLGAGVLLPHTEVKLAGESHPRTYEYNYAGPAGQALAGLEIRFQRLSLFVEYKLTYGHYGAPLSEQNGSWLGADLWRQLKRWIDGEAPPGGHVATEIVSHQVVSGLAVRLAARPAAP